MTAEAQAAALRAEIATCRICANELAAGPRPIVQFSAGSKIVIIGQAPGARVHASGVPQDDASGTRLREWTGLTTEQFDDPGKIALLPMGFCYPGTGISGDRPPRPECAPFWHDRVFAMLPTNRLLLLVGSYAQQRYLPRSRTSLTERVRGFAGFGPSLFPLPHPSWRSSGWMAKNRWFEADVLPALRSTVQQWLA